MQYKPRTDKEQGAAQMSYPESQPRPPLHILPLRTDDGEVREPPLPLELRTLSVRERAMAASAPGTEYWLP